MKNYSDLENSDLENEKNGGAKCSLFDRLKKAIEEKKNNIAKGILASGDENLQEVLGTSIIEKNKDGTTESFTFLTYAIEFGEIDVAQDILDTASQGVVKELLNVESIILRVEGTKKFTALSLAENNDHTDLANKIREKLGIPVLDKKERLEGKELKKSDESLVPFIDNGDENFTSRKSNNLFWAVAGNKEERLDQDDRSLWFPREGHTKRAEENKRKMNELLKKDSESLGSPIDNRDENFTIRRASNNLFWAVLRRDGEAVKKTLKILRNQSDDITQVLQAGLIVRCIGGKRAEALATKGNREIIRDIKTGQALVISLIGLTMVFLAAVIVSIALIPPELTAGSITGIIIAGFMVAGGGAGVGFAIFHDSYKIPDTQVEKVGTDKPPAQVQGPC